MDERRIKRLVVMLIMAIVIIMVAKYLLTEAVTNVGNAALEKKHAAAAQQASVPAPDAGAVDSTDTLATSAVEEAATADSAPEPAATESITR